MNIPFEIKGESLNTDYVTRFFEKIIINTENPFLSTESRDSLSDYIALRNTKNAKALWKNLLVDAICLLKINDGREKLYSDTKDIFDNELGEKQTSDDSGKEASQKEESSDHFFLKHFSQIRRISTYGIEEVAKYFDDFVAFEKVLYGTGEFYRDHIHHVLQVWGLGVGLLWANNPIVIDLTEGFSLVEENFHFEIKPNKERILQISKSELWAMWAIIALCHDLGYPLEKASQINQSVRKIVNHFGCLNFNELNFSFDILNTFVVEKYLKIISSKTVRSDDECDKSHCEVEKICPDPTDHSTKIQHKYYDKFSKSLEDYKHGAFSGLLLFKKLTYFLETDFAPDKETLTCEDLRQFYIRKELLRSICGHTCHKIYHLHLNSLPFLLIYCDELQEWGRPRLEDLLSGKPDSDPKIKIAEFKITPRTDVPNAKDTIIKTEVVHNEVNIPDTSLKSVEDHIIRPKFETFHYLLRSAKDDAKRSVEFVWKTKFANYEYLFEFKSSESSYKMFNIKRYSKKVEKWEDFHIYPTDELEKSTGDGSTDSSKAKT